MKRSVGIILSLLLFAPTAATQDSRPDAAKLYTLVDLKIEQLRSELLAEIGKAIAPSVQPQRFLSLVLSPVSQEFREVHRLPQGCGLRVMNQDATPIHFGRGWLRVRFGDVIVDADGEPVRSVDELGSGLRCWWQHCSLHIGPPTVLVIRDHEWVRVEPSNDAQGTESRAPDFDKWEVQRRAVAFDAASSGHACVGGLVNRERAASAPAALADSGSGPSAERAQDRKLRETADQMADRLFEQAVRKVVPGPGTILPQQNSVPESQPRPK